MYITNWWGLPTLNANWKELKRYWVLLLLLVSCIFFPCQTKLCLCFFRYEFEMKSEIERTLSNFMASVSRPQLVSSPSSLEKSSEETGSIFEGQLSKFTNVVKGWQYRSNLFSKFKCWNQTMCLWATISRWFVLDSDSGTFEYFLLDDGPSGRQVVSIWQILKPLGKIFYEYIDNFASSLFIYWKESCGFHGMRFTKLSLFDRNLPFRKNNFSVSAFLLNIGWKEPRSTKIMWLSSHPERWRFSNIHCKFWLWGSLQTESGECERASGKIDLKDNQ